MTPHTFLQILRFWRHLRYHKYILKHLRWTPSDEQRLKFYQELIAPGDLVFDVGANMGNRSKIFRKLNASVIAFEPQSYCADFLSVAFSGDNNFKLAKSALSDHEGQLELHIGKAHTLSTIDTDWIARMEDGGRFSTHKWTCSEKVDVTTLDSCISKYGMPSFVKIDVEGHELSVVRGLSFPVKSLSLEFASESLDRIFQCIDHLETLAPYEYRLSLGETMRFEGKSWSSAHDIQIMLVAEKEKDPLVWGDIYARQMP